MDKIKIMQLNGNQDCCDSIYIAGNYLCYYSRHSGVVGLQKFDFKTMKVTQVLINQSVPEKFWDSTGKEKLNFILLQIEDGHTSVLSENPVQIMFRR